MFHIIPERDIEQIISFECQFLLHLLVNRLLQRVAKLDMASGQKVVSELLVLAEQNLVLFFDDEPDYVFYVFHM